MAPEATVDTAPNAEPRLPVGLAPTTAATIKSPELLSEVEVGTE